MAEAYLLVRLGFVSPDKSVYHLLVDEAQDYSETALKLLAAYFPMARATLLGDPMQRTCPGMDKCDPSRWNGCFGVEGKVYELTRLLSLQSAHRPAVQRHSAGKRPAFALWPGGRNAHRGDLLPCAAEGRIGKNAEKP